MENSAQETLVKDLIRLEYRSVLKLSDDLYGNHVSQTVDAFVTQSLTRTHSSVFQ